MEKIPAVYSYDKNGRIIIPDQEELETLPSDGGKYYNRLVFEQSPYLLQHAANPVNWYPWGPEAFEAARQQDKPIFLSIGYTTCHWCHVMEHESFEDSLVAALMNETFICIKVDREERPDIDNVYMAVTTMLNGRGGWPMTVLLTPDKKPFFAGTYFPKNTRGRRIGMLELIPSVQQSWQNNREDLVTEANSLTQKLKKSQERISQMDAESVQENIVDLAFQQFDARFDEINGGFGTAPKFPKPHDYSFLARYWKRTGSSRSKEIIEKSLTKMRYGGIYDQIGFGFHRYSTDEEWLVPHFEKMMYDQAMLIHAYLDAYLVTRNELFSRTVKEIITYVRRDLTDETGGFFSAEDADSEGEEGKFYIWNTAELKKIITSPEDFKLLTKYFSISEAGNFPEGYRTKKNILHISDSINSIARENGNDSLLLARRITSIRQQLFNYRQGRVHPQKDDKILTDWNGLMISAIARAARILPGNKYEDIAEKASDFFINNLIGRDGALQKRYSKGASGLGAFLEDYAYSIWAFIEMYQLTFNIKYLQIADELSQYQILHFWDEENGGFFETSDESEKLLIRNKDVYDGAIPSGNSVSANNFIKLSRILSKPDYEDIAYKIFAAFSNQINRSSTGQSMMLQAIDFANGPSYEILLVGSTSLQKTTDLMNQLNNLFEPNSVMILVDPEDDELFEYLPYLKNYPAGTESDPLVYICENFSCQLPTSDFSVIKKLLGY